MRIGTCWIDVQVPGIRSLKEKRRIVRSIKEKIRNSFNVSIAEIGAQDKWQRVELGISCVGTDSQYLNQILSMILEKLNHDPRIFIIDHRVEIF